MVCQGQGENPAYCEYKKKYCPSHLTNYSIQLLTKHYEGNKQSSEKQAKRGTPVRVGDG